MDLTELQQAVQERYFPQNLQRAVSADNTTSYDNSDGLRATILVNRDREGCVAEMVAGFLMYNRGYLVVPAEDGLTVLTGDEATVAERDVREADFNLMVELLESTNGLNGPVVDKVIELLRC